MRTHQEKFNDYMRNSHKKHYLGIFDLWEVRGEDDNADFAGPHHEPFIALCEGKYEDVVHWAVEHPRFYSWGSGGSITRKSQKNIVEVGPDTWKDRINKKSRIQELEDEISKLKNEIGD